MKRQHVLYALSYAVAGALGAAIDAQNQHVTLGHRFQFFFVDVEVGENVQHVVVVLEMIAEPEHAPSVVSL